MRCGNTLDELAPHDYALSAPISTEYALNHCHTATHTGIVCELLHEKLALIGSKQFLDVHRQLSSRYTQPRRLLFGEFAISALNRPCSNVSLEVDGSADLPTELAPYNHLDFRSHRVFQLHGQLLVGENSGAHLRLAQTLLVFDVLVDVTVHDGFESLQLILKEVLHIVIALLRSLQVVNVQNDGLQQRGTRLGVHRSNLRLHVLKTLLGAFRKLQCNLFRHRQLGSRCHGLDYLGRVTEEFINVAVFERHLKNISLLHDAVQVNTKALQSGLPIGRLHPPLGSCGGESKQLASLSVHGAVQLNVVRSPHKGLGGDIGHPKAHRGVHHAWLTVGLSTNDGARGM